ncbi:MAG: DUF4347 domain-containing protein [Nodosilinea sp.]
MSQASKAIVFIDANVADVQHLVDGVLPGIKVEVLSAGQDGISQISAYLQTHPANAVHIIAHGAPGCLYLGNTQLSLDTLASRADQLTQWFVSALEDSLSASPALLLYGCNVAAGDAGEEFLAKLHTLTQASIAASTDKIGQADLGGSWNLDTTVGSPVATAAFAPEAMATYAATLQVNESYLVTEDNESQARNGVPDGDFNTLIGRNNPLAPIEFNIVTDADATTNAFLLLNVNDVDRAEGEEDEVSINGNVLGLLEGQNNLNFQTVFRISDLSVLVNGTNFVEIDIDLNDEGWQAAINSAQLLLNYDGSSLGDASVRFGETDQSAFDPGDPVTLTLEIDTSQPSQTLNIQSILRNPAGEAVAFDTRPGSANFAITGSQDDPFTWQPTLPNNATRGRWSIDSTVFDATTGELQFINTETFQVGPQGPEAHTDFNGDGSSDIVWRNTTTGENYLWYLNSGVPFQSSQLLTVEDQNFVLAGLGDFDSDGNEDDLVWRNRVTDQTVLWLTDFVNGQQQVVGGGELALAPGSAWAVQFTGDIDGDSYQDDLVWRNADTREMSIWYTEAGNVVGGGAVEEALLVDLSWFVGGVGDFDTDGLQDDLLWRNVSTGQTVVWFMDGLDPTGSVELLAVDPSWRPSGVSDYNSNGIPNDILWRNDAADLTTIWFMDQTTLVGGVGGIQPTITDPFYVVG